MHVLQKQNLEAERWKVAVRCNQEIGTATLDF